ncbi:MAG: nucleotidyl transferase AbiEii/AbiGii toxin family protein [Anaerolineae bacterium]|nr:MAG: nucleotidyl transferase AbiEii/AbiGii toxin family protein [Anaerolineae bacterium]
MLTRAQIQRLAQRNHIGIQTQERDYIQHVLLYLLYTRSQALIFKGGTALRIIYRGNRYSEDLDFNGPDDVTVIQGLWQEVISGLQDFGMSAEIRNAWQSEVGYSFDVSYRGPLYDGRDRTKGKIRVDISLRQEIVATRRALVTPEYDDLRPFVITALTVEHLMAEKMRALLVRGKPRDLYDLWLLTAQGIKIDSGLLRQKMELYDLVITPQVFDEAVGKAAANWERDLRPLLPQFVTWDEVSPVIENLKAFLYT